MMKKIRLLLVMCAALVMTFSVLAETKVNELKKMIDVQNPVVFQLANGANATGSKMTIYNHTDKDLIIDGFTSNDFKRTMLHSTRYESGKRVMFHVDHITVPAHKKLALTPNTHHFMLFNPIHKLKTGEFLTLKVHTNQGEFDVIAQVVPRRLK
ncbi:copper chaperone PCu(A)C [Vibrio salinus]|uniref:copper chaperone PCu(A)C n=1 Tax=Vibrio salinus TaxID=2899784 RepID=UPI001E50ED68|nr:copper chaperone PCu(A)C [Vibrio salinus]MCE0495701.1 copper chaperone PCu(A)C [Vibrio salinus]